MQAAGKFVGRHDFRNLCKMDIVNVSNFERTIMSARVFSTGKFLQPRVTGESGV